MAPVYINLDAGLQETRLEGPLPPLDPARFRPGIAHGAAPQSVAAMRDLLTGAKRPVLLAGRSRATRRRGRRGSRSPSGSGRAS